MQHLDYDISDCVAFFVFFCFVFVDKRHLGWVVLIAQVLEKPFCLKFSIPNDFLFNVPSWRMKYLWASGFQNETSECDMFCFVPFFSFFFQLDKKKKKVVIFLLISENNFFNPISEYKTKHNFNNIPFFFFCLIHASNLSMFAASISSLLHAWSCWLININCNTIFGVFLLLEHVCFPFSNNLT